MSDRMAILGQAVAIAGIADVAQGAEILAGSEDVGVMSALVGMMSVEDIEHGLELARLSGELQTASEMLQALKMPVLSTLLAERAARLHEMSVEQIRRAISTDGISQVCRHRRKTDWHPGRKRGTGRHGTPDFLGGGFRRERGNVKASENLAGRGIEEMVIAGEVTKAARAEAIEGVAEISGGSAVVGAAIAMDEMADTLKEKE